MKLKLIATLAIAAASTFAQAESVSVGYSVRDMTNGTHEHQTSLSVKSGKLFDNVYGDVGYFATTKDASNALSNRIEVGLNKPISINSLLTGNMRVATGWKQVSGVEASKYYVFEPSVTAPIGSTGFDAKVGYRVRRAYDAAVADNSTTTRLAVGYALTKRDRIALSRDNQRGDGANTQTGISYTRSF
jgi:hypothetical protein